MRSLAHSAFLFPTNGGDKTYGYVLDVDPNELKSGSLEASLQSELTILSKSRRTDVADIIWPPPPKEKANGEKEADNTETEMLKSLGYIDADE